MKAIIIALCFLLASAGGAWGEDITGEGKLKDPPIEAIIYAFTLEIDGKTVMQITEEELLKMSMTQWQNMATLWAFGNTRMDTIKEMAKRMFPEYFPEVKP